MLRASTWNKKHIFPAFHVRFKVVIGRGFQGFEKTVNSSFSIRSIQFPQQRYQSPEKREKRQVRIITALENVAYEKLRVARQSK